jgi:hypothetical protein
MAIKLYTDSIERNSDIADVVPLAVANLLQTPLIIYSSKLERPMESVQPDMKLGNVTNLIGSFWHIWQLLAMNIMMPVSSQR